jgi:hypothetical protein
MSAAPSLPTIKMFWFGAALGRVQQLALRSFVANGHAVQLYVYEKPIGTPADVECADAQAILPRSAVFRHKRTGSLAPFSDWFRYRMLLVEGGIWCDADIVCLRPFDFTRDVVIASSGPGWLNNAVLGLPAGHALARWLNDYCEHPSRWFPTDSWKTRLIKLRRKLLHRGDRARFRYGETGPKALTRIAKHLGLDVEALPAAEFFPLSDAEWRQAFDGSLRLDSPRLAASRAIHLSYEMIRRSVNHSPESRYRPDCLFEQLCSRYGV